MNALIEQFKWARLGITIFAALALAGLPSSVQSGEKCGGVVERGLTDMPGASKAQTYQIFDSPDGYTIELPPQLIAKLPVGAKGTRTEITLVDPVQGRTVISGEASKISGSSFKVTTGAKLRYKATVGKTWILIRVVKLGGSGGTGASCTGCAHASDMLDGGYAGVCCCPCS